MRSGIATAPRTSAGVARLDGRPLVSFQLHPAGLYLAAVITAELVGSAMVICGRGRWVGALWLAGITFIANLLANAFWTVQGAARFPQQNSFFEHWGLIGGLLLVAWIDLHDRLAYRSRGAD